MAERITIEEAAQRLGLTIEAVKRQIRSGELTGVRENKGQWIHWLVELPDTVPPATLVPPDAGAPPAAATPPTEESPVIQERDAAPAPSMAQADGPALQDQVSVLQDQVSVLREEVATLRDELAELRSLRDEVAELRSLLAGFAADRQQVPDWLRRLGGQGSGRPRRPPR